MGICSQLTRSHLTEEQMVRILREALADNNDECAHIAQGSLMAVLANTIGGLP